MEARSFGLGTLTENGSKVSTFLNWWRSLIKEIPHNTTNIYVFFRRIILIYLIRDAISASASNTLQNPGKWRKQLTYTQWFSRSKFLSPIRFTNDESNSQIPMECSANYSKNCISWEKSGNILRLEQLVSVKDARDFIMRQLGRIWSLVQLLSSHTSSFSRLLT